MYLLPRSVVQSDLLLAGQLFAGRQANTVAGIFDEICLLLIALRMETVHEVSDDQHWQHDQDHAEQQCECEDSPKREADLLRHGFRYYFRGVETASLAIVRCNAETGAVTRYTAHGLTLRGAAVEEGISFKTSAHIRAQTLGIDALLLALAATDVRLAGVAHHVPGVAFAASRRHATSILAGRSASGRAKVLLLGILVAIPALAAVWLDTVAIDAVGRADGIAYGVGARTHAVALVAATASFATFAATVDALLRAVRLAAASGPALGIAPITLADLRRNAVPESAVLCTNRFTDIRLRCTGSIAGEAATLIGRHTGAMDTWLTATGHAVGRGEGLVAVQASADARAAADAVPAVLGTQWLALDVAAVQVAISLVAGADIRRSAACIVATHGIAKRCTAMRRDLRISLVALAASGRIAEAIFAAIATAGHTDVMLPVLGHMTVIAEAQIGRHAGAVDAARLADRFTASGNVAALVCVAHVAGAFLRFQAEPISTATRADRITEIGLIAPCLIASMTAALVGRHTVPMHALFLAPGHTTAKGLVALIVRSTEAYLRLHAVSIAAIDGALRLTHAPTAVAQAITFVALADIGPSAASIDAGLTALRQADTAIRLVAVALVA